MDVLKNYIKDQWVHSVSKETNDVLNPASGEILAKVPVGSATGGDVAVAVSAASIAWQQWKDVPDEFITHENGRRSNCVYQ